MSSTPTTARGPGRRRRLDARGGFPLFRLAGIQVRIDPSWLLIFLLVLWSLSAGYFPRLQPDVSTGAAWAAGLLATLLFFASVLAHEISHSLVAKREGLEVPSITLFLFGGASEMSREPDDPGTEMRIAIVGPLMSFALAGLFALVARAVAGETPALFVGVLEYLGWINLALGVFNLLPGLPLDGGRVLRAAVWWRTGSRERGSRVASRAGKGLALGLMVLGGLQIFSGALVGGIWLILIGLFLRGLAEASYQSLAIREALEDARIDDVMARDVVSVPSDLTLQALIDDYILRTGYRGYPVVDAGEIRGVIGLEQVKEVPVERRREARVRDHLQPVAPDLCLRPGTPLSQAFEAMGRSGAHRLLVVDASGALVGLLSRTGLARFLELRRSLSPGSAS